MKKFIFNYCKNFKCIADKCRHSCCVGWEIKIDKRTLGKYASDKLCGVDYENALFLMNNGRCSHLSDNNLCDLISEKGEKYLCRICKEHPRFNNYYRGRKEIGVGLACEEAARLLLSSKTIIKPVPLAVGNKQKSKTDVKTQKFIKLRNGLLSYVQKSGINAEEKAEKLYSDCNVRYAKADYSALCKLFYSFEELDCAWKKLLLESEKSGGETFTDYGEYAAERFFAYLIARHFYDADFERTELAVRAVFCSGLYLFIRQLFAKLCFCRGGLDKKDYIEILRLFSSEAEYSENNLFALLSYFESRTLINSSRTK